MVRLVITAMLCVYAWVQTPLHQLAKLPELIAHFEEHSQVHHELSIWQFLQEHYGHGNPVDSDHEKDMKLPFKKFELNVPLLAAVVPALSSFVPPAFVPSCDHHRLVNEPLCEPPFHGLLAQPPCVVA